MRKSIEFELEDLNTRPDPEPLLAEMLHQAAFKDGPLANPKLCPLENINKITREDLYLFQRSMYLPSRTVLACIGIDHKEFVQMTQEKFNSVVPLWEENKQILGKNASQTPVLDTRKSVWKGGPCIIEKDLSDLNQGSNNQMPVIYKKFHFKLKFLI